MSLGNIKNLDLLNNYFIIYKNFVNKNNLSKTLYIPSLEEAIKNISTYIGNKYWHYYRIY